MKKSDAFQSLFATALLLGALAPAQLLAVPLDLYVSDASGSVYEYTPAGTRATVASGLSNPRGLTFDNTGNLLVATSELPGGGVGTVLKFNPDRTQSTFGTVPGDNFLEDMTTNPAGNVFVAAINLASPTFASTIFQFIGGGIPSAFGSTPGETFGLAFNTAGELFAGDIDEGTIFKFDQNGARSVFASNLNNSPFFGPFDLAFDSAGNLFATLVGFPGQGQILEFTPDGTQTVFASGLASPAGLAFDAAGNLFVSESGSGQILEFTPDGAMSVFASGLSRPTFLAFGPASGFTSVPDSGTTFILFAISAIGLICLRTVLRLNLMP